MYPTHIECSHCGQPAPVIRCAPIYEDTNRIGATDLTQSVREMSCKIHCPKCGIRVQVVKASDGQGTC